MRRARGALTRRYGHAAIERARGRVRGFIAANPEVAAALLGGTIAAVAAGVSPAAAAVVGATTGVIGQRVVRHCKEGRA